MATLTAQDVKKIADLARLEIEEKDIPVHAKDLSNILDFVEQINQVNSDNIDPMAHPLDTYQRLRADEVTETDQKQLLQSVAPKTAAGLYLVPKVIEACEVKE